MAIIGYARVSTTGQTLESQIEQLTRAGVDKLFQEKISAKNADRPQLTKMMYAIQAGDVVLVTRLDRLARSTLDLLSILDTLRKNDAGFRSIAETWADTTTAHGRLLLTLLGGIAEFERELILSRTGEGRRRAMAAGVRFGRPAKMTKEQRVEALQRLAAGETLEQVAATYNVHYSSISRLKTAKLSLTEAIAAHSSGESFRRGH